jgi:hypothetical protein
MSFCKSLSGLAAGALFFLVVRPAAADSILLGGVEDYPGVSAVEHQGDYNDLMFMMTGNISVLAPQAAFNALTQNLINESGTIFWDQHSYDGSDYNFGYCATGLGNCSAGGFPQGPLDYLAAPAGAAPLSELFQAIGTVTVNLLDEKSSNKNANTLGWYDPARPTVLHAIFAGPDSAGASATFTPSGVFALYSTNGVGQFYSSLAADNQQESATQQHFAFLETQPAPAPEPGTGGLAGLVLGIAIYTKLRTRCG